MSEARVLDSQVLLRDGEPPEVKENVRRSPRTGQTAVPVFLTSK